MTAVACLRVVLGPRPDSAPARSGSLIARFASAFFETRWLWPRQFEVLANGAFLLTDPRADEMDIGELARLAEELESKLFGAEADGEVALLLFQGTQQAVSEFSLLSAETLFKALKDGSVLPPGGRLTWVASRDLADKELAESGSEPDGPEAEPPTAPARRRAVEPPLALPGAQGIYFTLRHVFSGDVVSATPANHPVHFSLLDGTQHIPPDPAAYDADCAAAARRFLAEGVRTTLYLPICYSSLVRASQRAHYERVLAALPSTSRSQLAAAVYDTPRDPAFAALSQVKAALSPYLANIDLRTVDPDFVIENLQPHAVTSVTLGLPDSDTRVRLAVLRRFVERLPLYRRKQIWPAVTNVRTRVEVETCAAEGVPFITGPAVCRMQPFPVGGRVQPLSTLPLLAPRKG